MSNVAIISTGDHDEDQRQLAAAQVHEDRMNEGLCPNGCAELEWETPHRGICPECNFALSTGLPYNKRSHGQVM